MDTDVLYEAFELAMHGTSVALARRRTVAWLLQHSVAQQAAQTAELITSELVTNALLHSGSDVIVCALHLDSGLLRIEVTDRGTIAAQPTVRRPGSEEVSGRGLLLVDMLCREWGVIGATPYGRTVWAVIPSHE